MLERVISGVILIIMMALVLIFGGPVLFVFCLLISVKAFFELTRAMDVRVTTLTKDGDFIIPDKDEKIDAKSNLLKKKEEKINLLEILGAVGVFSYYSVLFFTKGGSFVMLSVTFTILILLFVYVFAFPKYDARQIMATLFSFIYAPIMLGYLYLTRELDQGFYIAWLIIISSWVCDTCAYFTGVMFGKHKMAPILSPKKSIEGAVGGVLGSAIVGFIYAYVLDHFALIPGKGMLLWAFPLICGIGALISMVGDLAASAIKRNFNIKDYGTLIPGHGGIMDRFDSIIFTAPVIYYLAVILI